MQTKISGTKEWADQNENLFTGKCPNNCIYCYEHCRINQYKLNPAYQLLEGKLTQTFEKRETVTMYPSHHDLDNEHIDLHLQFINNFLKSGSKMLIVTKPNINVMYRLCYSLASFADQIEFRFTIGSTNSETLKFYEPNAPDFSERVSCAIKASVYGFKTSLSIEPMLDEFPDEIIERLKRFISGDIWVGKMNKAVQRVSTNGHKDKLSQVRLLADWQANDENILNIVNRLSHYPNIKWKDSIQQVIERSKQ